MIANWLCFQKDSHWLFQYCSAGKVQQLKYKLRKKKCLNLRDEQLRTPLMYSVNAGQLQVAELLLELGADTMDKDEAGNTALYYGIELNDQLFQSFLELFLAYGFDSGVSNAIGQNLIMEAICWGQEGKVPLLQDAGVDIFATDNKGKNALMYAAESSNVCAADLLLKMGIDVNARDDCGETALLYAADGDCVAMVNLLLNYGADIEARSYSGLTPLLKSAREPDCAEIDQVLLKRGANIFAQDQRGFDALDYSIMEWNYELTEQLLKQGIHRKRATHSLTSTLYFAIQSRDIYLVDLLVEYEVPINGYSADGLTPLLYCIQNGYEGAARYFLDHGADLELADSNGCTPLMYAVQHEAQQVLQALIEKGASPYRKNKEGKTALQLAAEKNNYKIMACFKEEMEPS